MATPSLQTLQRLGAETGYQPGTLEKALRLIDLLEEIAGDAFLRDRLALKGGTALNVFHLGLARLSVDIDLNYIGSLDRDVMLADRPQIEEALQRILAAQRYRVRRLPEEHAGGKWIASYASALGGAAALEVDLNYMMRQPLFGVARINSVKFGAATAKNVLVIDLHEIIAGKLVALLDRRAARDLFDARRIFDIPDVDWRQVKAAMLAIGAAGRNDWRKASIDSIGADLTELRQKLVICLPRTAFAEQGSVEAWIAETTALCRERVAPLLALSAGEKAFLDGVIEQGTIDASGLDADAELQARIAAMPMLHWKASHVRKQKG